MSKRAGEDLEGAPKRTRSNEEAKYRLPEHIVPSKYYITVWPDFVENTFDGYVQIVLGVKEATNVITFHELELTYDLKNCALSANRVNIPLTSIVHDAPMQRASITVSEELKVGTTYILSIRYRGSLNDKLAGFYRSTYTDTQTGEQKVMAVTQFEATDARRALPCWDEPSFKARFVVHVYASGEVDVLSNMPIEKVVTSKDSFPGDHIEANRALSWRLQTEATQVYEFAETPVMSTYLLAWVVGEFGYVEGTSCGVQLRVYTPKGEEEEGKFALDLSVRCLEFYNNWFGTPYPLPKLDMVAIPDFAAGAMENWGLLTYRHTKILIGDESSAVQKQGASRTICHEIAHQWFGNLVTMEWWDDLWLNEGFARFMEHLAVDALFPEWKIWDNFVNDVFAAAQRLDALETSHPIHVRNVWSPEEISEIFDSISYAKGGSVLRMLFFYLGEEQFQKGLRLYLQRHQYGNARSSDLWKALEDGQTGEKKAVARVMDQWIHATGFPLVTAALSSSSPPALTLSQTRYLSSGAERPQHAPWVIPITFAAQPDYCALFEKEAGDLKLPDQYSYLKLNSQQSGFYRVHYSDALLEGILRHFGELSASDKLGLQSDLFALSQTGKISTGEWLSRLPVFFEPRMNHFVLSSICTSLRAVCKLNSDQPYYPKLKSLIVSWLSPVFAEIGWDKAPSNGEDPHIFTMTRAEVITMLAMVDYEPVVAECTRLFREFGSDIDPNLQQVVLTTAVRLGEQKDYDRAFELCGETEVAAEKTRFLTALGLAVPSLQKTLEWAVKSVRVGDAPILFASIGSTPAGRTAAWSFLKDNWAAVKERFHSHTLLADIVGSTISGFAEEAMIPEIQAFFASNPCPSADRTISQGIELIIAQAGRKARDVQCLTKLFAE